MGYKNVCKTVYEEKCEGTELKEECTTVYENKCRTTYEKKCSTSYVPEYEQERDYHNDHKHGDELRYIAVHKPKEVCQQVPKKECQRVAVPKCLDYNKPVCKK